MTQHSFSAALDTAMRAYVVEGEVVVLGPDGVALSLTPDAAEASAHALLQAANDARSATGTDERSE